jgi:hypothetical protein
VATHDGDTCRLYVDGVLEVNGQASYLMGYGAGPMNIGAEWADGATAASNPHFGRIDEAFVTPDVLSDDQVRLLYAAKIPHTYGSTPTRQRLTVTRRRRGGPLVTGDFPSTPLRLHNFTGAALTDAGSNNVPLVLQGAGTALDVAGPDGTRSGAYALSGTHQGFASTDAGLPSGTAARSFGGWFKTTSATNQGIIGWSTTDEKLRVDSTGALVCDNGADTISGPFVRDGSWHHAVVVDDNSAADGVKRKLYLDGKLVAGSTTLNAIALGGANRFRVGSHPDGTSPFTGSIDGAFVTGAALTGDQVFALYSKGSNPLPASPAPAHEFVEAADSNNVYSIFDAIEPQDIVNLEVAA